MTDEEPLTREEVRVLRRALVSASFSGGVGCFAYGLAAVHYVGDGLAWFLESFGLLSLCFLIYMLEPF